MKTIAYHSDDKQAWGTGPWTSEPDKLQWQDETTSYPCLIVRSHIGALCGYVGITAAHPWFGKSYSEVDEEVACHGGLTFSDMCQSGKTEKSICHVPDDGESADIWWFGFDCAHAGDICPAMNALLPLRAPYNRDVYSCNKRDVYCDLAYVKRETENLALQLRAVLGNAKAL